MKITITAGHGGRDPGACANDLIERDLMTELRDITARKLTAAGHTVRTDGARLENWPLLRALTMVPGSDVAIELHTNAAETCTVWTDRELRELVRRALRQGFEAGKADRKWGQS